MLSNFTHDSKPLVQVFLLGQEEFRGTLLSEGFEQLRQRVIATYHLNPLTDEETRTYIEHRLSTVGWSGNPHFSDEAFTEVYEFSEGVPRRINNLCDRLLLFSFLEERKSIDVGVVKTVAEEIGSEFWGRTPTPQAESSGPKLRPDPATATVTDVFNTPGQPLESMANMMFDKANFQQRLASMEASIDRLTESSREELAQIRSILLRLVKTQARMLPPYQPGHDDTGQFEMRLTDDQAESHNETGDAGADNGVRSATPTTLPRRGGSESPVSLSSTPRSGPR